MNTKRQRVVVTLVVALATLATMGFVSAEPGHHWSALVADVTVCEFVESVYLSPSTLDALDESCASDFVIEAIVIEIESGLLDPVVGERILSSIYEQRRSSGSGSVENVSSIGVGTGEQAFSSASSSAGRKVNNIDWMFDYIELEEPEANAPAGRSARRGGDIDWIINYVELEEPATDESMLARIRELSRGSWELYTLDELEREESSGLVSPSIDDFWHQYRNIDWFANYLELVEPGTDPE